MKSIIFTGYERSSGVERVSGAYRIATVLRREGWDVEVVDFFYHWSLEELKKLYDVRSERYKIDWIGFSTTWINYSSETVQKTMMDFISYVKEKSPDTLIIAGGQNPSVHFEIYNHINYVIAGFGEVAVIELMKEIYGNGGYVKKWPREGGGYIVDANTHYQAWPTKDLTVEYEDRDFIAPGETLAIEISRGCKFACAFCNFPVLGVKEDTTRDLKQLDYEFRRNYDKWGITNYQIADETLNDRDEKLAKMGSIAKSLDFDLQLDAFIRGDILFSRPQQLELLAEARVWGHYYGIETFNHETGKIIGKGLHPDKIKAGLLETRDYFLKELGLYRGTVSLVYGLPKETKQTIEEGLDWLCENWSDQSVIAFPYNINLTGNKSKIDKDFENYGYHIMSTEKRKELNNRHNFFANDLTIWENDHMNMYDAVNAVDRQIKKFKPGFTDCWKLFSLLPLCSSVQEGLKITESDAFSDVPTQEELRKKARLLKTEYIGKKLSW